MKPFLLLSLFISGLATAQIPSTDIYLFDLEKKDGRYSLSNPVNITAKPGYDNQPFFSPDGSTVLYTSSVDGGQTDIFGYNTANGKTARLTNTPESEYSPTIMPDERFFSVIQVEKDSTQRLWKFPITRGGMHSLVLENVKPVGYHAYPDAGTVAMFVLGEPNTLQLAGLATGMADTLARNIGRSFHRIPGTEKVSFVDKSDSTQWMVRSVDGTKNLADICPTLPGREDLCWAPGGVIFMGSGSKLFARETGKSSSWVEVQDLAAHGITSFSRMAVSPDGKKIAVVAAMAQ